MKCKSAVPKSKGVTLRSRSDQVAQLHHDVVREEETFAAVKGAIPKAM